MNFVSAKPDIHSGLPTFMVLANEDQIFTKSSAAGVGGGGGGSCLPLQDVSSIGDSLLYDTVFECLIYCGMLFLSLERRLLSNRIERHTSRRRRTAPLWGSLALLGKFLPHLVSSRILWPFISGSEMRKLPAFCDTNDDTFFVEGGKVIIISFFFLFIIIPRHFLTIDFF